MKDNLIIVLIRIFYIATTGLCVRLGLISIPCEVWGVIITVRADGVGLSLGLLRVAQRKQQQLKLVQGTAQFLVQLDCTILRKGIL